MNGSVFINRVVLKNYKSIASCSVRLQALTFLVGPNGSGKSNFPDALRLVGEALNTSLDHALRERGGINEVRRRSSGHPTHFGIRLEFTLPDATSGYYAFRVGAKPKGGFEVQREECRISPLGGLKADNFYLVNSGVVEKDSHPKLLPPAVEDRLLLVRLIKQGELERSVELVARKNFGQGGILLLLDCEDECPAVQGPELLKRAALARQDLAISVVLAKREYEAWFLAAAESLRGHRGLPADLVAPERPEDIRGAKEWLSDKMPYGRGYAEVSDQPALTAAFDMDVARRAGSFDKCFREIVRLINIVRDKHKGG